ncbi:Hypothetical predicted protein [Pelobates cultripes]|uniref:Endonuclease/exonuclease/phosphatase domain-containing protein n=1 Tax=Pelobates cultripes TaxID=61616 RepID=A0AAD1S457_PELCU|nr:Hypothetical predicted protein [Pelobates cultripes]
MGHSSITQGALRSIQKSLKNLRLVDCWRAMHPADREYTHYSVINKRYARIDYIFLQQEHLDAIQKAEIGSPSWSDHGPVTLQLDSPRVRPSARSWRLQDSLLLDPSVKESVSEELTSYFALNDTDDLSATTIWEAHKSVLRGTLMRLASQKKRESRRHMTDLLTRINALEMQHKRSHLEETYKELLEARRSLHAHMTNRHYSSIQRSKAFFYQHANKGGRLLARMLRGPQGMTQVHKLRTSDGTITQFPDKIASEFRTFYASLYNIPGPTLPEEVALRRDRIRSYIESHVKTRLQWGLTSGSIHTTPWSRVTGPPYSSYPPPAHPPSTQLPPPHPPSLFLLLLTQLTLVFSLKLSNNGFIMTCMINVALLNPRLPTIVSLTHTYTSKWKQTPSSCDHTTRIRHTPERHLTYNDGPIDLTTPKRMRLKGDKEILEEHIKQTQGTNLRIPLYSSRNPITHMYILTC